MIPKDGTIFYKVINDTTNRTIAYFTLHTDAVNYDRQINGLFGNQFKRGTTGFF